MTEWETIHDDYSHISQVKIIPPKNYSVERGNGMFDAVSKSSIPKNMSKSKTKVKKSKRKMNISTLIKYILFFTIAISATVFYWQCSNPENSSNNICLRRVKEPAVVWIKDTTSIINQSYAQVTQPLISKLNDTFQWIDNVNVKANMGQLGNRYLEPLAHQTDRVMYKYTAVWNSTKAIVNTYLSQWRQQLDEYISSGHIEDCEREGEKDKEEGIYNNVIDTNKEDSIVQEKIKKTAKRILDYIDQLNQETFKTGMKQEEAREKAQEIIKSITSSSRINSKNIAIELLGDKDVDLVTFEIESIMQVATIERIQLKEQLESLQSHLVDDENEQDLPLISSALKSEIDLLRANAENNVKKRTREALQHLHDVKTIPQARIKQELQQSQRTALKDLRQVYREIYQTNQMIDNLSESE